MRFIKITKLVFCFMCIGFIMPQNAFAYMDPGTGSYIFQIVIAFILGGLFTVKQFWKKIIGVFKKN